MNLVEMRKHITIDANGFYDKALGKKMKEVMSDNEPQLRDYYKTEHNLDLKQTL